MGEFQGINSQGEGDSPIESVSDPRARRIADILKTPPAHARTIIIDDPENIAQAVASGVVLEAVYVTEGTEQGVGELRDLVAKAPRAYSARSAGKVLPPPTEDFGSGRGCQRISVAVARSLFGGQRRSRVFALARRPPRATLAGTLTRAVDTGGDLVILDGVRLVGNIGAIIRTACAFGAAGVVLLDSGLSAVTDRRLIRSSRGLVFALPVAVTTEAEFLVLAHERRFDLAVLDAHAPEPVDAIRTIPGPLGLVLGSEKTGATPQVEAAAGHRFSIAMLGGVESLNVSVAAGIALAARAQRGHQLSWPSNIALGVS